jgi:integrase
MNTTALPLEPQNIVALPPQPKPKGKEPPFRVVEFHNYADDENGKPDKSKITSTSWRVVGWKRDKSGKDGGRVRENYSNRDAAEARKATLVTEWLTGHIDRALQETDLTRPQLRLAENAFARLGEDNEGDLMRAVEYWLEHGKKLTVKQSVRLDEAFKQYKQWLDTKGWLDDDPDSDYELRALTVRNLKSRVNVFVNSVDNRYVNEVTVDTIRDYLRARSISPKSKDNDRRGLSSFFSWAIDQGWTKVNPCQKKRRRRGKRNINPPAILTIDECKALLNAAEAYKGGKLVPYVALCLFGALRPWEASRIKWGAIFLADGKIRIDGAISKTGRMRVIEISPTLKAWLTKYQDKAIFPGNFRRDFDLVKATAGFDGTHHKPRSKKPVIEKPADDKPKLKDWIPDIMRHTAISHFFRNCGDYGFTAEWAGNSQEMITQYYQGFVDTKETKAFYSLRPTKGTSNA